MAFDLPIGFTSYYNFPKFALGSNPGADALNEDILEAIDSALHSIASSSGVYSFSNPLKLTATTVSIEYEDNLKLSVNNKLDTAQAIKTTSMPQFAKIAIGGTVDASYSAKIYGSLKVTGDINLDGNLYINGSVNQWTINELQVVDHLIRLNNGGDDSTAINGGIILEGTLDTTLASILFDSNTNWTSNISFNLATGKSYKINNVDVLNSNTLGSSIINSSLTKVGTITTGSWTATPIIDAYISSSSNWNSAYANMHVHSNITILNNTTESFTTALKTNYDAAYANMHIHSNLAYLNVINQNLATTNSPQFSGLTLTGTATLLNIIPNLTDTYSIGNYDKYWKDCYISKIVATVFAEESITAIGGFFYITKAQGNLPDVSSGQSLIDFGQTMYANDFVLIKSRDTSGNYKTEYMQIISLYSGTQYYVTRDVANLYSPDPAWAKGTVFVVLGQNGNGRIELNAYDTPRISLIKQGAAYNSQTKMMQFGDLNGLADYATETYGFFVGDYSGNKWLSYDTINSLRIRGDALINGTVTATKLSVTTLSAITADLGSITAGSMSGVSLSIGSSNNIFKADTSGIYLGNAIFNSAPFRVDMTGNLVATNATVTGTFNTSDGVQTATISSGIVSIETITGMQAQTDITAQGLTLQKNNGAALSLTAGSYFNNSTYDSFYINPSVIFISSIKMGSSTTPYFQVDSSGRLTNMNSIAASGNTGKVLRSDGTSFTPATLSLSDLTAITASKITVTDSNGKVTTSSINSSELFEPVYGSMIHANNSTSISSDVSWEKYTGFTSGSTKNTTVSSSAITVSQSGKYIVSYSITYAASSNTGNSIYIDVFKNNGSGLSNEVAKRSTKIRDTNNETLSHTFEVTLAANDYLDLRFYSTDIDTLTLIYANLIIFKVSN